MPRPPVLVTGCAGLLGSALTRRLSPDYTVVGADVVEPEEASVLDEFRECDLTDDASADSLIDHLARRYDGHLASVVHLAAYYDFSGEESPLYDEITVEGTRRLLRGLRRLDHVEQFLFTSTMLVHAPVKPGEWIAEDSPLEARWAYPRSKLETEEVIREERGGIPCVMLRLAGVYTDQGTQPTLVQQIRRIHTESLKSFFFPGDVEAGQSMVHLDDAVDALVRTVDRRRSLGPDTPILVGEPDPPSYAELQDRIGEGIWGTDWPTLRVPEKAAEAAAWLEDRTPGVDSFIKPFMIELADDHYGLDIARARTLLAWNPRHRILERLPLILSGLRSDPDGWYEANGLETPPRIPRVLPEPV